VINEEDKFQNLVRMSRKLAHQLNNQLTSILANTQLISLILKDEELRPYLKSVEDVAHDTGATVRNFQEAVRALAGSDSHENMLEQTRPPRS
jgi:signal transduction histidine kinase